MRGRRLLWAALVTGAVAITGCGSDAAITGGGTVIGETLTVASLLPLDGARARAARDIVDGEKLALAQAGGRAGAFKVNFTSFDQTAGRPASEARVQAATVARNAITDAQVAIVIADLGYDTAAVSVPLFNSAGILHLTPGATYAGFTSRAGAAGPDEPARFYPAGTPTLGVLPPTDASQAEAIATAAPGRVAVEAEASPEGRSLDRLLRRALGRDRLTGEVGAARSAVYAGTDPESAAGVVEGMLRENPGLRVYLPEALYRSDLAERLGGRARRVAFMTSAPVPDAAFVRAFRAEIGRAPGPYAPVGYDAMRKALGTIAAAGDEANRRQALIDAFFARERPVPARWRVVAAGP